MKRDAVKVSMMLVGLLVPMLAGCATSGPSHRGGRVDPGTTTAGDRASGKVYIADLDESSDRIAEALIEDLSYLAQNDIDNAAGKSTLVYGDIDNRTTHMPTRDFQVARDRIQDMLINSRLFRQHFRIIDSMDRFEALRQQEGQIGSPRTLDPSNTYFLNGNASELDRDTTRKYYFNFQLMRMGDGEIIFSKRYEQAYHK